MHAPQLLSSLEVHIESVLPGDAAVKIKRRLWPLSEWLLQRSGPHVRRLLLQLEAPFYVMGASAATECAALCMTSVLACSQVVDLELELSCLALPLGSRLLPLAGSLRRLTYSSPLASSVEVADSLACLTALEALELGEQSDGVILQPAAQLPSSLTRLYTNCYSIDPADQEDMPNQARCCTCSIPELLACDTCMHAGCHAG